MFTSTLRFKHTHTHTHTLSQPFSQREQQIAAREKELESIVKTTTKTLTPSTIVSKPLLFSHMSLIALPTFRLVIHMTSTTGRKTR